MPAPILGGLPRALPEHGKRASWTWPSYCPGDRAGQASLSHEDAQSERGFQASSLGAVNRAVFGDSLSR